MKRPPVPRPQVYDLYWHFAAERQQAFERRLAGEPAPWTSDRVLQTFKFCNVFRAADRVSQFLIKEVAYSVERCAPEDRLFQIVAFRVFSKIDTWRSIRSFLGRDPVIRDLDNGSFAQALDYAKQTNGGLYTGAFILCATNAYGKSNKHENHVELFRHMFLRERLGPALLSAKSLEEIFKLLLAYPLIGDFMAYQIAIDLNYSEHINFSENDFTQPGPGAMRGIRKVFESLGDYSPAEIVHWMVAQQKAEFLRLNLSFNGLWGRPLHAIDCQGLFCETDKYCREVVPDLLSARKRIKARFSPTNDRISYFFPPKWNLNDKIQSEAILRGDSKKPPEQFVLGVV